MASLNKVMIIGNLGADPEMRYTANGSAVTNFNVAVNESWSKDGERQERTEWFAVVAWNKAAETCAEHLSKGSQVFVEGRLQTRSWEKDGQKHYRTEIVADNVRFLDGLKRREEGTFDVSSEELPF